MTLSFRTDRSGQTVQTQYRLLLERLHLKELFNQHLFEPRHEKTNVLVSDQVRHKPGCTATEDSQRLEISDLESRGIVLDYLCSKKRR